MPHSVGEVQPLPTAIPYKFNLEYPYFSGSLSFSIAAANVGT